MPARIDTGRRRREVIDAAFRLVVAEGMEGPSLRKVAEESGINIGSVRHYFDGHEDLLAAAAYEAGERMGRRLAAHPVETLRGLRGDAAVDALAALVEEVLPLDEERREEAIVVVEFVMASRTRPVFRTMSETMAADLHAVLREALEMLGVPTGPAMPTGAAESAGAPGSDADVAAAQISALVGGLTMDAITPHGAIGPERVCAVLRAQLRMMLDTGSDPGS